MEKRYVRPSGEVRWAWLTLTHVAGPQGQDWMLAHVQDVTERHGAEQALADSEANLTAVSRVVRGHPHGAGRPHQHRHRGPRPGARRGGPPGGAP